jgi:hypothetical protein
MRIFNPNDIAKVKAAIKEQEITSQHIEFEIPFYYDLKLNDNVLIKMQVKQLTYEEYQQYYAYHSYITNFMSEIGTKNIDVNSLKQVFELCFYLTRLSECLNPEVFIDKEIFNIYKAEYTEEINKKSYKHLFRAIVDICKHFQTFELKYYKAYTTLGKLRSNLTFSFFEYRRLKNASINYLKHLSKIVIDYYISKILYKTKFNEIIDIFNHILLYNTYIKKNLMTVKQEISNRMKGSGKQTHTLQNSSKITIGDNYLTLE